MKIFSAIILALFASVNGLPTGTVNGTNTPITKIPAPDGLLHVYALPIGQGAAKVVQCPSGTLSVFDMGTSDDSTAGFWYTTEVRNFLQGNFNRVKNIVLTHNHFDHYSLLDNVFLDTDDLSGLTSIYVSCTRGDMVSDISNWINNIGATNKVVEFNGGGTCGSSGGPSCGYIDLCPGDPGFTTQILSVNAGQQCTSGNKNIDSVVVAIQYNSFKIQLNGDFEDFTSSFDEVGPQKAMVDFYGPDLQVTVYMISHHGAQNLANKPVIRSAVAPKAVFASANPWYSNYRHPRCDIFDGFMLDVQSLCQPGETNPSSSLYCGPHPISNLPLSDKLQSTYTCGPESGGFTTRNNNDYAIYTTTPDSATFNLVHLLTDGTNWGFINNISPKIVRAAKLAAMARNPDVDECFH